MNAEVSRLNQVIYNRMTCFAQVCTTDSTRQRFVEILAWVIMTG